MAKKALKLRKNQLVTEVLPSSIGKRELLHVNVELLKTVAALNLGRAYKNIVPVAVCSSQPYD